MFPVIVFALVSGAVFFASLIIYTILRKAARKYQERYLAQALDDLSAMFLFIDPRQMLILNACSVLLLGVLGYLVVNPFGCAMAAAAGLFFPPGFGPFFLLPPGGAVKLHVGGALLAP